MSTTELALEFKKRNNPNLMGVQVGIVLSLVPLRIGTMDNEVILDKCTLTETFSSKTININDKVLVVCEESLQTFFIIDRLVM